MKYEAEDPPAASAPLAVDHTFVKIDQMQFSQWRPRAIQKWRNHFRTRRKLTSCHPLLDRRLVIITPKLATRLT